MRREAGGDVMSHEVPQDQVDLLNPRSHEVPQDQVDLLNPDIWPDNVFPVGYCRIKTPFNH